MESLNKYRSAVTDPANPNEFKRQKEKYRSELQKMFKESNGNFDILDEFQRYICELLTAVTGIADPAPIEGQAKKKTNLKPFRHSIEDAYTLKKGSGNNELENGLLNNIYNS